MNQHILAAEYSLQDGILASVAYFFIALLVLALSFVVQDLLTPGRLRDQVFVHHLPNAAVMAGSQLIAIGMVLVAAIATTEPNLVDGIIHVAVYSLLGLTLQTIVMVVVEIAIPGRFRNLVEDRKLRSSTLVLGVLLVVVGAVNAVCLT
ncbi:DUF350 domain-containing protein [Corynebacterium suicordis]|uniref:DUF350 domain-containing protein n=1 Tax=Corynebacterium suicordis DSM 45110 TaxID=1121369 RepID=A0ABR9ZL91_9CORY|nr:DUF350 domain-containing protein [Corynebacterium suicordis]MBF4554188.1 DUF350 domain-containing protein [Corynebacterium suicordis DSM 45110]MDR6276833.1 uncharacterized membrane protein YjfL (UPF0719 family) [Corynebacterium suicordis]